MTYVLFGNEVSPDVYEANKHLLTQPKEPKTQARKDIDTEMRQLFARQFEATWALLGGPELEKEVRFDHDRQWRLDYVCQTTTGKWAIELEGGVYMKHGGGHRSKSGYIDDVFKYNAACLMGYRLIRIATGMINAPYIEQIIKWLTG